MAETKEKKYVSDNAQLMAEWNFETNINISPNQLTLGCHKKVWWKCEKGHEWQASVAHRNNGTGCPYCYGRYAIKGENDLQTVNPSLAKEWHFERNGKLTPADVTSGSYKKVWWKCEKGHEWQAKVSDRTRGTGCPYCYGRFAITGENDLQTVNPDLANEWNFEKNGRLIPSDVLPNSNKKVWWKCTKGHEWEAQIGSRSQGNNCPYCAGQKVLKGYNDLQTVNPKLAAEWNSDKNAPLLASDVMPNSNKKAWWKCSKGHEWEAVISTRNKGIGCPICSSERNTSLPEYMILYYLKKHGVEAIHTYKGNGYELDIYIPSRKIAIEYDGYFWHGNKIKKDLEKNKKCTKDNITLYRVREGLPLLNDSSIDYVINKNRSDLPNALASLLHAILGVSIDINLERDAVEIENLREHAEKESSILLDYPQLALEWNYEKNGTLKPEHCTSHSNKKVWWKCNIGHEWKAVINSRSRGNGCPYCCGRFVIAGENDLQTINPSLASEWNYDRNGGLSPKDILPNSNKKIWWKCNNGHEWQTSPNHRSRGGNCPYCSNKKVLLGYNDLQTVNPSLALEWNLEKNGGLMPKDVTSGSAKKVWWKCKKGHEWQRIICSRTRGDGCPYCSGRYAIIGENDLKTVNPSLAKEWHFERNGKLTPADVTSGSDKKVWWKCEKGHEWQAVIGNRNKGTGCPYCYGRYAIKGLTDLQTTNPFLAKEWNHSRNQNLTPFDVTSGSNKKVWWICDKGHEWRAQINNRSLGNGCPKCARMIVSKKNSKAVGQFDDNGTIIRIYQGLHQAARDMNITPNAIFTAVKNGKKSKGFYWKYIEEGEL